ncbi:hypothetical protein V6N11_077801 [Hibiscus sabdariffa]|uniref:Uncharacterized protein n=1 Tax=Hibiscus sabdariffa TaxID=183260 RepID=A0ABR2TE43_9ROSI
MVFSSGRKQNWECRFFRRRFDEQGTSAAPEVERGGSADAMEALSGSMGVSAADLECGQSEPISVDINPAEDAQQSIVFSVAVEVIGNEANPAGCGNANRSSKNSNPSPEEKKKSNASQLPQMNNVTENDDDFDDDQVYASLDLDAMEAQATILLKNKYEPPLEKREINAQPNLDLQNGGVQAPPSFDLGIW